MFSQWEIYEDYRWKSNKSKWDGGRPTFWDQGLALELSDDGESYTVVEGWVDDDKIRKKEFVIPRKYLCKNQPGHRCAYAQICNNRIV